MTGVVETAKIIWIHPPRFEEYIQFTEYAPFPEFNYNYNVGHKWNNQLILGSYGSDKYGKTVQKEYIIYKIDTVEFNPLVRNVYIFSSGVCKKWNIHTRLHF